MAKPKAKEKKGKGAKFPETVFVVRQEENDGTKYLVLYEDFTDIDDNEVVAVYEFKRARRHNVVHSLE
ncbi:MAG: hypothetical protein KGI50_06090 [Patescibacteria group bacterium]|nr:hypothetical protein [Patescibacteria group bacterium]MDE2439088.1 hypothetical protein [Patescibacteria group bacterium]